MTKIISQKIFPIKDEMTTIMESANKERESSKRDLILLHMIDALDYAAYISGIEGIRQVELEPVELGYRLYMTGFKIELGQPMVHIKHIKQVEYRDTTTEKTQTFMLNPDMDIWLNATVMDEEMVIKGVDGLYKCMRETGELHVLHLTYNKVVGQEYVSVTESSIYSNKRTACKDAMTFRKKQPCKLAFTVVGSPLKGGQQPLLEHKMTDLEFANAALE